MGEDTYRTIRRTSATETKVKGSRFIAEAVPAPSEEEAVAAIAAVRKREYDATHHCSAYRVGTSAHLFRYDDDGEPSGTAGSPILRQIEARELTNIVVVVTRYYGGTKLGTGGLMRAYGEAAGAVLDAAEVVTEVIFGRVYVSFDYEDTSPAMHTIDRFDAHVVESKYTARTELEIDVPRSRVRAFEEAFIDALGGRGEIEVRG